MNLEEQNIILFDGHCNLCNSTVITVIKNDKKKRFKFAALQSDIGKTLLSKFEINTLNTDSIILIEANRYAQESTAVLKIARHLSGLYPLLYGFIIIPTFIRNSLYKYIAKNRYKWFGRKDQCMVPSPDLKARFL